MERLVHAGAPVPLMRLARPPLGILETARPADKKLFVGRVLLAAGNVPDAARALGITERQVLEIMEGRSELPAWSRRGSGFRPIVPNAPVGRVPPGADDAVDESADAAEGTAASSAWAPSRHR